jgi:copper transport protein
MRASRLARLGPVVLAAALIALSAPSLAWGHAELIRSAPAEDSSLAAPPKSLSLGFSQPVVLDRTDITVLDDHGRLVASVGKGGFRLTPVASNGGAVVTTPLPPLGKGLYKVLWRSLSKDDYHNVGDQFVFAVGLPAPATGAVPLPPEPRPRPAEAVFRWISFLGAALLAGAALMACVLRRRGQIELARRAWRPATAGAALALGGAVAQLLYQTSQAGLPVSTTLTETTFGQGWLVRALLLAACLGLTIGVRQPSVWVDATAGLALVAAAAGAIGSHASAFGHVATIMLALHLAAAAAWAGVVFIAAVVFAPALRNADSRDASLAALRAVAVVAIPAVAVLAITGLYSLGRHVASVDALITSIYGGTLLVKTALVVTAAVLGLLTHRFVRERGAFPRVIRAMPIEAGALGGVLLAAAVMAAGAPARGIRFDPPPPPQVPTKIDVRQVDDLLISLEIKPNTPGANFVTARVINTRRPPPAAIGTVTLTIDGQKVPATPLALANQTDCTTLGEAPYHCHWEAPVTLSQSGQIPLAVAVTRPGLPDTRVSTQWTIGGARAVEVPSTVISRSRLEPLTLWLALAVALGGAAVVATYATRRSRTAT